MSVQVGERVPARIRAMTLPPFDPLNRRAAVLRAAGHHVISLGQAVPFFGPPPSALEAVRQAIDTPAVHRYAMDPGLPGLRRVLAERLSATLGGDFAADELVITAGANHAFALALSAFLTPGDEVILPAPYFTNHQMMVCALGMTAVEAPVADAGYAVRWSDIAPHVGPRTRAIVLCNPSNPTGAAIDAHEGRRIVAEASARGLTLISDETYLHFVYEGTHWSAASCPAWRDTVVTLGTFSKSFGMMGWRLGFLLADAARCEQAIKVQDAMIICAPVISQVLGEAAASLSWSYPLSFHEELRARRRVLADGLARIAGLSWTLPRAGLFAFVRVAGCSDSVTLANRLLEEAHIVTIPGAVFGRSGEGCLRLSFGFASEADLAEATGRLRRFLS